MNVMTQTLERKPAETASIADIAETTAGACLATRVRQLSRIVTRVYDDAMRPLGITASQYTLLAQLAARDSITAVYSSVNRQNIIPLHFSSRILQYPNCLFPGTSHYRLMKSKIYVHPRNYWVNQYILDSGAG